MPFMTRPRMRRIDALHGDALITAVRERENESDRLDAGDLLRRFAEADPSRNKSATQWLVRCYLANGFRLEDLSKAYDTLVAFAHHRRRLPVGERDLGRYRTLADLWKAIRPFAMTQEAESTTGREARRRDRERARAESKVLFEGEDGFTVAVPMTEFASCWWGRGTRWCTAAEKGNRFSHYHASAPLIVILLPDGQKLQFFAADRDIQFLDADDREISSTLVEHWWPYLEPIIRWATRQEGRALYYVPEDLQDSEICLEAVRQNGLALEYVSKNLRDSEMCLEAVKQNGGALRLTPRIFRDRHMCIEAIKHNGIFLGAVPKGLQDREMCLKAVGVDGTALQFVPLHLRDFEMCVEAVGQNGNALGSVPSHLRNREMCLRAIRERGRALRFVYKHLLDREMCLEAVVRDGRALNDVPEDLRDREMCIEAVRACIWALEYVPEELQDQVMRSEAIKQNAEALEFAPEGLKDRQMCLDAVRQDGWALRYVPEDLKDREMCAEAVRVDGAALSFVPEHLRSELREIAVASSRERRRWQDEILDGLRFGLQASPISEGLTSQIPLVSTM